MSDTLPHHPTIESTSASREIGRPRIEFLHLSAFPAVAPADFEAARAAAARFGSSSRSLKLTLAPFGDLVLTFSPCWAATPPNTDDAVYQLRRGRESGWLILPGLSGLRIVAAVLGIPAPRVQRAMGVTERGVLAAVIAAILRFAPGTRLTTSTRGEWSGGGRARIEVSAACPLVREAGFLDVPPSWIPASPDLAPLVEALLARDLRISLSIELARTTISAAAWSRAELGDALVFEERSCPPVARDGRQSVPVDVLVGKYAAAATCTADGRIRFDRPFGLRGPRQRSNMSQETTQKINSDVLASAPIEIVAEVGRLSLRADEVVALAPGSVLTLGQASPLRVELRVGDERWASGELVNVEGQLGVRLLAFSRGPATERPPSVADSHIQRP